MTDESSHLELEQYKQRLEKAEKELEVYQAKLCFLRTLSHDFRTPLSPICSMPLLLFDTALTSEQRGYVDVIQNAGKRLLRLVNNYFDFLQLETETAEMQYNPFAVREVVENIVRHAAEGIPENVSLTSSIAPDVPSIIMGDRWSFGQVLLNLVDDALRYARSNVTLSITFDDQDDDGDHHSMHCLVQGDGLGLMPTQVQALQKFFAQPELTPIPAGVSMGLVLNKRLSDLVGGTLQVESVRGQGSSFRFILPCKEEVN